jgi:ferredoxin
MPFLQIIFFCITSLAIYLFYRKISEIKRNILLGQDELLTDQKGQRWKNVFFLALGQKKMFKKPFAAILHLFVYAGFIIINIEMIEIIIDGVAGTHRIFSSLNLSAYHILINIFEILAAIVLIFCIVFITRRKLAGIKRFQSVDIKGWPSKDATIILLTEIILMLLFLTMNATDTMLQDLGAEHYAEHVTGHFIISHHLFYFFQGLSISQLLIIERSCWWLHILGVFAFLNYLPWSKHLHIVLAFPNAYFARLTPRGQMTNMPSIQQEVLYAFKPEMAPVAGSSAEQIKFGAKDVFDLSWKNLLDAYSCTECGRCSAECPANQTGKLLSPRKMMMDTRDRLEEVGKNINQHGTFQDDEKSLLTYISEEELRACTTCSACIEACPVSINPMDIILQIRRYVIMEKSSAPQEWTMMFGNMENNFAPWKFAPDDRGNWIEK